MNHLLYRLLSKNDISLFKFVLPSDLLFSQFDTKIFVIQSLVLAALKILTKYENVKYEKNNNKNLYFFIFVTQSRITRRNNWCSGRLSQNPNLIFWNGSFSLSLVTFSFYFFYFFISRYFALLFTFLFPLFQTNLVCNIFRNL
jgi:hypothetical protein